jgi:hypothetical protein
MGYGVSESMGYGSKFPANQLGILEIPWGIREYGLPGVWVKRGSTVEPFRRSLTVREREHWTRFAL